MPAYTFVPIDEAGLAEYASWFTDAELRRRVEPPTPQWFDYVRHTPGCHAWLVLAGDGAAIGSLQLDIEAGRQASIGLVVKPDQRGQGHGRAILRACLRQAELARLASIEAIIEAGNVASLRCFEAAGFLPASAVPDVGGFLKLVYHFQTPPRPAATLPDRKPHED